MALRPRTVINLPGLTDIRVDWNLLQGSDVGAAISKNQPRLGDLGTRQVTVTVAGTPGEGFELHFMVRSEENADYFPILRFKGPGTQILGGVVDAAFPQVIAGDTFTNVNVQAILNVVT